jgi:Fe-S-cluster containining protein
MTVYEIPLKDGLQEIVAKAIQENGSDTELSTLFNSAISCASAIIESVRQSDPPLEVLHIATTILETYTEDERERLFARLATAEQRKQAHSLEDWGTAKYPCPLLVDEKCSVYETRPFVCRAMNSYDGDRCRVNRETPRNDSSVPMYSHQYDIAKFARTGIQQGLLDAGLQNDILELVPALRIALTTPDALIRWLSGEKVFEEAVSRLPPRSGQLQRGSQNNELPESDDGTPQTRSNAL